MTTEIKKRILIVEDEIDLSRAIQYKLEKEGLEVLTARSGEEALKVLENNSDIDMIWLDLLMSGMGGLVFLERIKKNDSYKNIPVIIVSVSSGLETVKKVTQHKVLEYIMKGQSDLSHIIEKVKNYLK